MDNLSGQNIKGYELRERIGTGGFGAVYKAQQSTVNREVAIKVILPHFSNHPDFIRRFETEAQLIARLEHLHIVPLYDYWRDPDGAYLVMRWLRGGSLKDALNRGAFTPEQVALILDQLASALATAHRSQVIHRDLKPGNILLDEDGNAYLADFGIAKDVSIQGQVTEPDAIIGSPDYLAPEQARGEVVTPATDVYSLGVVLFEMLTGEHPFPNISSVERLYKHLNEPLPLLVNLADEVRSAINDVIQKATAKNPKERYGDVLEMATAFRAAGQVQNKGSLVETLTMREQDILRLIINGRSNKEIAEELVIALNTVKWYVTQIYQKLGVRTRVQAIVRARELHLIGDVAPAADLDIKTIVPTDEFHPINPFKGLRSFQIADNRDFFGREKLIAKLVKRMGEVTPQRVGMQSGENESGRFLAVVGPSGSGKSSLVKAGLVPALWRGELPGSEKWFIIDMVPGAHPLDELEVAMTRVAANQAEHLREHLERDERGLVRAAQLILPDDSTELTVVIDQFEEVFTLVTKEEERLHFLNLILGAVNDPRSRVRIVVTLRADFYDRPLIYDGMGELFRSRIETILPLTADGLERAITQPAEQVGMRFETGLVAKIISEVNYQPSALPLLQYALTELFELRQGRLLTHEAYQSLGGTVGALAKRADELYLSMSADGQNATRQMFLRLVTLGEGVEDTRRRTLRSEILALTSEPETMDEVIDNYSSYRLLSLDNDPQTRSPTVEVAHEAIIREWKRLREWLNDAREDIKLQRQLSAGAEEWEESGREHSFLLRGSRLSALAKWSDETQLALTHKERTYLQESIQEQQRQTAAEVERQARVKALERRSIRVLRGLVAVLFVSVIGAFGLTGAAVNQSNLTQQALATSDANFRHAEQVRLAAQAQNLMNDGANGNLPALLAIASLRFGYSEQADAALLQASARGIVKHRFPSTSIAIAGSFSPDGTRLVTIGSDLIGRLWDFQSDQQIRELSGSAGILRDVAYSPNGRYIVAGGDDAIGWIWDAETGAVLHKLVGHAEGNQILSIAISPDSQRIVTSSFDNTIRIWDATTGNELHQMAGRASVAFSRDGRYIVSGGEDKIVHLWDANTWQEVRQFVGHTDWIDQVAISPDSKLIASASDDHSIRLWDLEKGDEIRQFTGYPGWVTQVDFSPDGRWLVSGGDDLTIRFWDVEKGDEVKRFYTPNGLYSVRYSPDGKYVLTSGQPDMLLWDAQFDAEPRVIHVVDPTGGGGPWRVKYSADNKYLLTAGPDTAQIWDAATLTKLYTLEPKTSIRDAALSPDGKYLFASTNAPDTNAYLYEVATGKTIRTFVGHTAEINEVDYSPDGKYVSTGGFDNIVIVWDVATGQPVQHFEGHTAAIGVAIFSADSKELLSSDTGGTIRLWDIASGNLLNVYTDEAAGVMNTAFSPDQKRIAASRFDGSFQLWDKSSGTLLQTLNGYPGLGVGVMFSRDGRYLLGSTTDRDVRLWDTTTGALMRAYSGHREGIRWATFSPDEKQVLAVGGGDLVIWQRDYQDFVDKMCAELPTDFTPQERQTYDIPANQPTCPQFVAATG